PPGLSPLSLHDALPICDVLGALSAVGMELVPVDLDDEPLADEQVHQPARELDLLAHRQPPPPKRRDHQRLKAGVGQSVHRKRELDRKSTRLNSSHVKIS